MAFKATMANVPYRVQVGALLPRLVGKDGMTIRSTIYLSGGQSTITAYLLAHEFGHVLQWRRLGVIRFLWRYLRDMVRIGYKKHPMEHEAHEYGWANMDAFEPTARFMRGGV